jgi:RNA polymerase primary sigma factor
LSKRLEKQYDPVAHYLREITAVPLLSHEEEIEIGKRIEKHQMTLVKAFSRSSIILAELVCLGERLKRGELELKKLINLNEQALGGKVLKLRRQQVAKCFDGIKELVATASKVRRQLWKARKNSGMHRRLLRQLARCQVLLEGAIKDLDLKHETQEHLTVTLKTLAERVSRKQQESKTIKKILKAPLKVEKSEMLKQRLQELRRELKESEDKVEASPSDLTRTLTIIKQATLEKEITKKELVQANLRLVVSIVKKYRTTRLEFLDLIQEGNIGLITAVDKWDYRKGCKFSTYAYPWIQNAVTRAFIEKARIIRIPHHVHQSAKALIQTFALLQENGREPTSKEVAQKMDIPVSRVNKLLRSIQEPISLDIVIGEGKNNYLTDQLEDTKIASPVQAVIDRSLKKETATALQTLTSQERKVISMRFGLRDGNEHTFTEIAQMLSLSVERIRQIEARALRKLRHQSEKTN